MLWSTSLTLFFFSSRRRHTRFDCDWSSDVCSSDLGGRIAMLGIMPGSAAIDWNLVVFHGLTIKGIYGREMFETWYKMTALIQSGLDISPIITHRFAYADFQEGFELMKSGNSGKIVLDWAA